MKIDAMTRYDIGKLLMENIKINEDEWWQIPLD